ncbi:hypothetical protein [Kribbella sp. NPDC003557]|uniref:hypothetical protein n=1 Tax=Kribbella sp. NPDC003557 TaxID=3154449 RepID=UPI0033B71C17
MRDSDPRTVRELLLALHEVEDELRTARRHADREQLNAVIERKRRILSTLACRRRHRSAVA